MRFLVDNQLPAALADWLRQQGHETEHVLEIQLAQAKDNPIWLHAQRHSAVIVTKDDDSAEWVRRGRPGPQVVWIRLGNSTRRELLEWILPRWPTVLAALLLVPNSNRCTIDPTVRIVSRLSRAASTSLTGSLFRRCRNCASLQP